MLARLVSQCLLSLYIYTCYPATQINLVNKYAASKVSLLYSMVFCLSVTHSLTNSFANAFFKYNVRRPRQAEIAFPRQRSIFLQRLGFRNDACRRQELLGGDVCRNCLAETCACGTQRERANAASTVHVQVTKKNQPPVRASALRRNGSKKNRQRAASCAGECAASERLEENRQRAARGGPRDGACRLARVCYSMTRVWNSGVLYIYGKT